jgi:hypothetical protein
MITNIIEGLTILKTYNTDAPIVTQAYMLSIPAIPFSSVTTGTDADDLAALGWVEHPTYSCYYYPTQTMTELADVTESSSKELPPFPVILPEPR